MRIINIGLLPIIVCFLIIGCSSSDANDKIDDKTPSSNLNSDVSFPLYETNYPLTAQYFQQFLNSEIQFCGLVFSYSFYYEMPGSDGYNFSFDSYAKYENYLCIDKLRSLKNKHLNLSISIQRAY